MLGLEQFDVGHSFGSSHGYTRIFRVAHRFADPYTPLAIRAGKLWEELEEDSQHVFELYPPFRLFMTLLSLFRKSSIDAAH